MEKNETPDLSAVIQMILKNPNLMKEISAMAGEKAQEETNDVPTSETPSETKNAPKPLKITDNRRQKLFSALKPYLSDNRAKALDSMAAIAELLSSVLPS